MGKFAKWDHKDFDGLVKELQDNWAWPSMVKLNWGRNKHDKRPVLFLDLHTGGHSENEKIINDLLKNKMIVMMWHTKWERGGHYSFEINPYNVGYVTVAEMAKKKGISRQAIHQKPESYHWITAGHRTQLIKEKK